MFSDASTPTPRGSSVRKREERNESSEGGSQAPFSSMGCCGSVNIAPETDLPPPEWGKPLKVRLKKKGFFSADYDVLVTLADGEEVKWMLLDAVGSFWDKGYSYFLKHRSPGQVDAAGKKTSTVLGAVNIRGEWDAFSFKVSGGDRDLDIGPYLDLWEGNVDWGISSSQRMWATWTLSKRAVLYSDEAMTNQIGWLDVTGSGTWFEEAHCPCPHSTPHVARCHCGPYAALDSILAPARPGAYAHCERHRRGWEVSHAARAVSAHRLQNARLPVQV